jgi:sugar lactone lactonase YvrE
LTGHEAESEIGSRNVYRLDADNGNLSAVVEDFAQSNGLAFSADVRRLFIVDSELGHIRVSTLIMESSLVARCSVPNPKATTASDAAFE